MRASPSGTTATADAGTSVIDRTTTLTGTLSGDRPVRVEGTVRGSIDLAAALEIAGTAVVEASVRATVVRIAGTVVGDVEAAERVELAPTARVKGDITAPALHVVEGAQLDGRVIMCRPVGGSANGAQI
jgi:cytoskeletal protein CcmA (bactofilin family)